MTFLEQLDHFDQSATLWINQLSPASWETFWSFLSEVEIWIPLYTLVIAYMFWRLGWKKSLILLGVLILTIVLTDQISYHIKESVQRPRPCHTPWMLDSGLQIPEAKRSLYGFFSSHASNTFGFAAFTCTAFKKNDPHHSYRAWGWIIYSWAALIATSRIMLGAHFLGDILVGTLFGLLMGWGMASLGRWMVVRAKV